MENAQKIESAAACFWIKIYVLKKWKDLRKLAVEYSYIAVLS